MTTTKPTYYTKSSSLLALNSSFETYALSAKERDVETGLSYFGARYDQASVLAGLLEYNSAYNLGYSNEDLEILSWSGLQDSAEYTDFIKHRAETNNRSYEEEDSYVKSRITSITFGIDSDE